MKLRDIEFGNILGASGVQGFFGEGYWFHKLWKPFGPNFEGMTFVAKTTTLNGRAGNMDLRRDYTPRELVPDCIKAKPLRGSMLNAVGLSGPGLYPLLESFRWQYRTEPFWISVMSVADSPDARLQELDLIVHHLDDWRTVFRAPFGLQINVSCPNTGHDTSELAAEAVKVVDIAAQLDVPIMLKFSIDSVPIEVVMELDQHLDCDAICVSNTLRFGWDQIDWQKAWGSNKSPLEHLGGGGLSGDALRPLVCDWIKRVRDIGFTKPINGGGGSMPPNPVGQYRNAGASSVFIGSVAALRPWRVKSIINMANAINWE